MAIDFNVMKGGQFHNFFCHDQSKSIKRNLKGGKRVKKVISLLLVSVLAVGNVGFAATAPKTTPKVVAPVVQEVTKTGIVVGFTDMTMTVKEIGKNVTYKLDAKTKVVSLGMEAMFADVIAKGMKVTFKAKGNVLTFVDVPVLGQQTQGKVMPITVVDTRVNVTDDSVPPVDSATTKYTTTDKGVVSSTDFALDEKKTKLTIGLYVVVPESIKLTVGDRTIKVLTDAKAAFDAKVDNDEAKYAFEKNSASITLEKALTADEEKSLKLSYDKKEFIVKAVETSSYTPSIDIIIELNGKPTTMVNALDKGNFSFISTNVAGEIIYMNSFYKELLVKVVKADNKKISFYVEKAGRIMFYDTVELDPSVSIFGADGVELKASDLKPYTEIELTVDPAFGYKATLIQVK